MSTVTFDHELGDLLKDKVTGFQGIVMVRAQYSTGCIHYGLQSQDVKDGAPQSWQWLDKSQVERVTSSVVKFGVKAGTESGPLPTGPEG